MKNFVKWSARSLAIGVVWVFILSIDLKGEMLFHKAHEILVQNRMVQAIDQQIIGTWDQVKDMARSALNEHPETVREENF